MIIIKIGGKMKEVVVISKFLFSGWRGALCKLLLN
jgi:hypothetical protein